MTCAVSNLPRWNHPCCNSSCLWWCHNLGDVKNCVCMPCHNIILAIQTEENDVIMNIKSYLTWHLSYQESYYIFVKIVKRTSHVVLMIHVSRTNAFSGVTHSYIPVLSHHWRYISPQIWPVLYCVHDSTSHHADLITECFYVHFNFYY